MHEQWTDRLSELLDGELSPAEQAEVESHLASCESCARVLEELKAVTERAAMLGELPPREDLWPAIHGRIANSQLGPRVTTPIPFRERRVRIALPQLIAASVVLIAASVGTTWMWMSRSANQAALTAAGAVADPAGGVSPASGTPTQLNETALAIADLERNLAASRARLDPETVRVIEQNLAVIDAAIAEVRSALVVDPGNTYLNMHLAETMQRKLQILQDVEEMAENDQ
jgi:anti-sigma factor RsiW